MKQEIINGRTKLKFWAFAEGIESGSAEYDTMANFCCSVNIYIIGI